MPHWLYLLPLNIIYNIAIEQRVDPAILTAIVSVESNGHECAIRYEPGYKWLFKPSYFAKINARTLSTERTQQKISWGLMQVMGAVAREHGHVTDLAELCSPETGIRYGAKHIKKLLNKYKEVDLAVSAYNQGSPRVDQITRDFINREYVDSVLDKYHFLKSLEN